MDGYIICGTPRTGSTLLCDLLASTLVAGDPDSFFMTDVDPVWADRWGLPDRRDTGDSDYAASLLKAAIAAGRGQTRIFGLRLMRDHLDRLSALIETVFPGRPSDKERLQAAFGSILYIHLFREDKLAQAVSLVKAEQTGLWHIAPDGTEIERLAPPAAPDYDFGRIAARLSLLEQQDAAWLAWFDEQGIAPLRIGYESLSANPADAVGRICRALGVRVSAPERLSPGVARLADEISREWMRRYRRDAGRTG